MNQLFESLIDDFVFENIIQESLDEFQKTLFQKVCHFEIALLKKEKYSKEQSNNICFICLEKIQKDEMIYNLKCGHLFHAVCIDNSVSYQHFNCPTCRMPLPIRDTKEHFIHYNEDDEPKIDDTVDKSS